MLMTLEKRQQSVLQQFDAGTISALEGVVATEYAAGLGGRLNELRRGREPNRPPLVTLEARGDGLWLGLVVSRPRNGRMLYDKVLGCWDFSIPLRGGPLNVKIPQQRRAAFWAVNLAQKLLSAASCACSGGVTTTPMRWPQLLVPFKSGQEKIDSTKHAAQPDARVDTETQPGFTLVDASIVVEQSVTAAIDSDAILEDYGQVAGEFVAKAGRQQRHPLTQLVSVESLQNPPWPYGGSGLPPVNWRPARRFVFASRR